MSSYKRWTHARQPGDRQSVKSSHTTRARRCQFSVVLGCRISYRNFNWRHIAGYFLVLVLAAVMYKAYIWKKYRHFYYKVSLFFSMTKTLNNGFLFLYLWRQEIVWQQDSRSYIFGKKIGDFPFICVIISQKKNKKKSECIWQVLCMSNSLHSVLYYYFSGGISACLFAWNSTFCT